MKIFFATVLLSFIAVSSFAQSRAPLNGLSCSSILSELGSLAFDPVVRRLQRELIERGGATGWLTSANVIAFKKSSSSGQGGPIQYGIQFQTYTSRDAANRVFSPVFYSAKNEVNDSGENKFHRQGEKEIFFYWGHDDQGEYLRFEGGNIRYRLKEAREGSAQDFDF